MNWQRIREIFNDTHYELYLDTVEAHGMEEEVSNDFFYYYPRYDAAQSLIWALAEWDLLDADHYGENPH